MSNERTTRTRGRQPADRSPRPTNDDPSDECDLATGEGGAIEVPARPGDLAKDD